MKPSVVAVSICAWVATLLCGCTDGLSQQRNRTPKPIETRARNSAVSDQYRIQPGDLLVITFPSEPDYNQQVRVDWDGRINLPFLTQSGRYEIKAAGLSAAMLSERISQAGKNNQLFVNAGAQVLVMEYSSQSFVLLGQVAQPGRYSFPRGIPPRLDLGEAIALGGGYTRLARQSLILVKRGDQLHKVNLQKLTMQTGAERFVVIPGDIITVTERIF